MAIEHTATLERIPLTSDTGRQEQTSFDETLLLRWIELNLAFDTALQESGISDLFLEARKKKPSGANKKQLRRQNGIKLPNEERHERNAGIAHGLIVGGKGGIRVRVNRKSNKPESS